MFPCVLFRTCYVMIFLAVVSRLSAGCRWRPSTSACLRSMLPSLSCCRRRLTPAHTPWSWSCRSWEITVTGVSGCAVSCLCVHLWQSRGPIQRGFWFIIHDSSKQKRNLVCWCIQHCYCTSLVIVCVCQGPPWNITIWIFQLIQNFCFFFLSDEPKLFKCNNISRAVTKECSEIIQVFIEHKPVFWLNFITVCCQVTNVFNLVSVCSVFSVFKRCSVKSFWRVVIQRDGRPLQWNDQKLVNPPPLYWRPEVICLLKKLNYSLKQVLQTIKIIFGTSSTVGKY